MQEIDINSLHANPKNPRTISKEQYTKLKAALDAFGDLSGIVFNVRTQQLVGGHQRIQIFKQEGGKPVIEERFDQPTSKRTVARGYVLLGDEKHTYREVDWNDSMEAAAMIAANAAGGDMDNDKLAENIYELSQLENGEALVALTAVSDNDLKQLNKLIGTDDEPAAEEKESDKLEFRITREQREIIEEALGHITATREMATEENGSKNGTALYYMSRDYLDKLHGDETQANQEI